MKPELSLAQLTCMFTNPAEQFSGRKSAKEIISAKTQITIKNLAFYQRNEKRIERF